MSYRRKKLLILFCAASFTLGGLAGCGQNTENDVETTENVTEVTTYVQLSDDEITADAKGVTVEDHTVTISKEGTYVFSGTLSEGQIIVDTADTDKVQIILDNVDITCATSAAIYVKNADKVYVTLEENSQNTLRNTDEYVAIDDNNIDAVIFSKSDLTLKGSGSLTIEAANGHGVVSKDDLEITGGTYDITAASHALSGKDSVSIADGTFTLSSGKDGIHSENTEEEEKGFVSIAGGSFTITSDGDGIDASGTVEIEDGVFDITAGGGAENGSKQNNPGMGGSRPEGKIPQKGEKPEGEAPQMGETTTEDGTSTKGIKADQSICLNGGTYKIDSADDAIHSNASVTVTEGTYTLVTGDDGIHADDALEINGGTITITESYEGLEGLTVTINDGTIDITASDDGVNAAGGADASGFGLFGQDAFKGMKKSSDTDGTSEMWMEINGGYLHVTAGGDGLDSNGDLTVNGGEIYIDGPSDNGNSAIDYGERSSAYINGGTIVAVGSSGMAEVMSESSKQEVLMVKLGEQKEAGEITLKDSSGNVLISYTAQKSYDCVIISTSDIESGVTYTLETSNTATEVTAD